MARSAKQIVLEQFQMFYPDDWTEAKILETDPNDFDVDPCPFYETLQGMFGVKDDPDNDDFGGWGGTIADTIAFVEKHWDGKLREAEASGDDDDDDDDE